MDDDRAHHIRSYNIGEAASSSTEVPGETVWKIGSGPESDPRRCPGGQGGESVGRLLAAKTYAREPSGPQQTARTTSFLARALRQLEPSTYGSFTQGRERVFLRTSPLRRSPKSTSKLLHLRDTPAAPVLYAVLVASGEEGGGGRGDAEEGGQGAAGPPFCEALTPAPVFGVSLKIRRWREIPVPQESDEPTKTTG